MAIPICTQFVESEYKSEMRLRVTLDSLQVVGDYRTPPAAGFLGGYVHGFGQSDLTGSVSRIPDGSGTVITGCWCHTSGLLGAGTFEVRWHDETKSMRGWWAETNGPRHDWIWSEDTGFAAFAHHFVHGIAMARFTIVVMCFVLLGTGIQTALSIWPPGLVGDIINLFLMAAYAVMFGSFVLAYRYMYQRPAHLYMLGVGLYAVGYMVFATYFWAVWCKAEVESVCLYASGSFFFVTASVCLALATWPKGGNSFSVVKKDAALFWGSVLFLLGSFAFGMDSLYVIWGYGYTQWLGSTGNALFTVGLIYFLWACTTPDVGFFVVAPRNACPRSRLSTEILHSQSSFCEMPGPSLCHSVDVTSS